MVDQKHPVIFFDGVCGLCNWSVSFILKIDKKKKIRFSPLQGITAQEVLSEEDRLSFDSLVFYKGGVTKKYSTGVLSILKEIGRGWRIFYMFIIIPVFIRDAVYRLVAKNRYNWFGKLDTCRVPTAEEKAVFLD